MKRLLTINGRKALARYVKSWFTHKELSYSELGNRVCVLSFCAGITFAILLFSIFA